MFIKKHRLLSITLLSVVIITGIILYWLGAAQKQSDQINPIETNKTIEAPIIKNDEGTFSGQIIYINSQDTKKVEKTLFEGGFSANIGSGTNTGTKTFIGNNSFQIEKNKKLPVSLILKSKNTLNNNHAEVIIPANTYVKTKKNISFTKEIKEPTFIDPKQFNLDSKIVASLIKVGSDEESLFFKNSENKDAYVTVQMPAPGYTIGSDAKIYSSEDGKAWKFHTTTKVVEIENSPYVVFNTNHFTLFTVGGIQWDNDKFIDQSFWDNNPNSAQIIAALYGYGGSNTTAYTQNRSGYNGECSGNTVVYTGILPTTLNTGTVYVLASGNYIITGNVNFNNCSALISSGITTITSSGGWYLNIASKKNTIIDNIRRNGKNISTYGISITQSTGNTINNAQFYNCNNYAIYISSSTNNTINNTQIYNNNTYGTYIYYGTNTSGYNIINNTQIYNNTGVGLSINNGSNNIINNSQFYNNSDKGIHIYVGSNNVINNTQIYNNSNGLYLQASSTTLVANNIFNNIEIYNNQIGININNNYYYNVTGNKYYGYFNVYNNKDIYNNVNDLVTTTAHDKYITGGIASGALDRSAGVFNSGGSLTWNKITNPKNSSGNYLLDQFLNIKQGNISTRSGIPEIIYSYGSQIAAQTKTVRYNNNTLEYYGSNWDSSKYIGGNNTILSGSMDINGTLTNTSNITLTFTSVNNVNWRLFGDITSETSGVISANGSITTGVTLSFTKNNGNKNIFVQFWTGSDYTHYSDSIHYVSCATGRDNDKFIDQSFWNLNPSSDNIICALYGSGGSDKTAYTENWSGYNNDCLDNNVVYTGVLPATLNAYTTYILASGNYNITSIVNLTDCSALISSGITTITSSGSNGYLYIASKKNTIIDNIRRNGNNIGYYGMYIYTQSTNNTINKFSAYYNTNYGIHIGGQSTNNTINNTQIYNNNSYGIYITNPVNTSGYNIINNTQVYNNTGAGILIDTTSNNTINNSQFYNNNYGIHLNTASNNAINNTQIYNNNKGIYIYASSTVFVTNNIFNNVEIYNNQAGIELYNSYPQNVTGNKYYGYFNVYNNKDIYNNVNDLINTTAHDLRFTGGKVGGALDRSAGVFNSGGSLTWNKITNSRNSSGNYLLDQFLNIKQGNISTRSGIPEIIYSYGAQIAAQTKPVRYNNNTLEYYGSNWDSSKYIGGNNNILSGSMDIFGNTTLTQNITLTFTSVNNVNWRLFGDITSETSGVISANSSITTGVTLSFTKNNGNKNIFVQFWTGSDYTHYSDSIHYVSCATGRDNDKFIDQSFWNLNPSSDNIICALYGSGGSDKTAYTENWSGYNNDCLDNTIVYTGVLPATLNAYTTYVLASGNYNITGAINLTDCSALISSGITTITSSGNIYLNIASRKNTIIDNIRRNGKNTSTYGISINSSTNNTINNTQVYNNIYGIYIYGQSTKNTINNTQVYNSNNNGIHITSPVASGYNIINNAQIYNNTGIGIYIDTTSNNTINNTQIYNNSSYGIQLNITSNNAINNTQIYNNNKGLYVYASSVIFVANNAFNNVEIYNNQAGIELYNSYPQNVTGNKYYGYFNVYDNKDSYNNLNNLVNTTAHDLRFTEGKAGGALDRSTGVFNSGGTVNWSKITNPKNSSGNYLLDQFLNITQNKINSRSGIPEIIYSYGAQIAAQTKPVRYNNNTLEYYGSNWDSSKYIGGNNNILSGSMDIFGNTTLTQNITLTFTSVNNVNWRLFGDITSEKIGTINANNSITTGVSLSYLDGNNNKRIFIEYWTGNDYTRYDDTIRYISGSCAPQWDNDKFIDQSFWDLNPTTDNIICALYGSGGSDKTAYTENWSGYNNNCLDNTVIYTGILPATLNPNTTYVLASGNYLITGNINLTNCSAIISSGITTITSSGSSYVNISSKSNIIIDNIRRDGGNNNNMGLYIGSSTNTTTNNFQVYKSNYGIYIISSSTNNTINNSQIYNNSYGIYIYNSTSGYNTINNTQIYNNNNYGIYLQVGSNNIINNSQIYNNNNGIYLQSSSNNIINNSQIYNNDYGINFTASYSTQSSNNILNNTEIFNNSSYGIYIRSTYKNYILNNKYYGYLNVYNNTTNLYSTTARDAQLNFGSAGSLLDRTKGSLNTTGTVSWNKITNPKNNLGNYLLNQFSNITQKNITGWSAVPEIIYSYGAQTPIQTQPVRYNGGFIEYYGSNGYSSKYIGSNNNTLSGYIQADGIFSQTTGTTLTFTSANNVNWRLFGDITSEITGAISENSSLSIDIILSGGEGSKKIFLQLWTGNNYTHYYTTINYIHAPTIQTGYIYSGNTGSYNGNIYFKGPITIRAGISDIIGIKTGSCEYSLTGIRLPASGTSTYCEATNITTNQNINIIFRAKNSSNSIGTGIAGSYLSDNTGPIATNLISPSNEQSFNQANVDLRRDITTDTGIGMSGYIYQISTTSNFSSIIKSGVLYGTSVHISGLDNISYYRRILAFDNLGNSTPSNTQLFTINTAYINVPNTTDTNIIASEFLSGGYVEATGSVKGLLPGYLVGAKKIRVTDSNGKLLIPLVMQSSGIDDKLEVQIPEGTIIKTSSGSNYTGILDVPVFLDTGSADLIGSDVSAVASFGGSKSLSFNDLSSESQPVTIRIPVPNLVVGDSVVVYYSNNDGDSWSLHTGATVISLDGGEPYVEFTTTHFTDFAIADTTGHFTINNNYSSTSSQNVVLNIYAPTAQKMRFSNDGTNRSTWETYNTTKSWSLTGDVGTKTVYAEFDFNEDNIADIQTTDSINYHIGNSGGTDGELKLEILGGKSECVYGTSLDLGPQDAQINTDYSFAGMFDNDWYCMDYDGISSGRAFTIQISNLTGSNGGIIPGSNVQISHSTPYIEGEGCTGDTGDPIQFYNAGFTLMEKIIGYNNICKVTLSNVGLQINVPANTAPGDYQGILTMTLPNGF